MLLALSDNEKHILMRQIMQTRIRLKHITAGKFHVENKTRDYKIKAEVLTSGFKITGNKIGGKNNIS